MQGREFDELVADIREHGLREPIVLHQDGRVIDGRNRARACDELGLEPDAVFYTGGEGGIVAFSLSLNKHRRHLTDSQWAAAAANIANMRQGERTDLEPSANLQKVSLGDAARIMGVSERSANSAAKIKKEGANELFKAVEDGFVTVGDAANVLDCQKEEQAEFVETVKKGEAPRVTAVKNKREKERLKSQPALVPAGKYHCIVIDPPWEMQKIEREVAKNQVAFEYPTMNEAELAEFPVADMAGDDCHLFCWTTHKHLPQCLRLLDVWGFKYVCTFVWHKSGGFQPYGLPQYNCEFVIYGRKGAPQFVDTKDFFCCFEGKRREHSRKPDEFYGVIRRVTQEPRIDVFSREPRPGFAQFGNEAEKFSKAS
jgi:N6-adenosine-specific RNA methylase IME4/ParB-like chromosome segregation protein Spo0J